jgi:diguanylate cyclase (GGDEF)-like protein/PAS domain S-box-containing protein
MKLLKWHNRTRLIFGVAFVTLIATLYAASSTILLNSLKKAEEQECEQIVRKVLGVVSQTEEDFSARFADWAAYDESYKFIQDGNQRYIDAGLAPEVLTLTKLNLIVFVRSSGYPIFGTGFDDKTQKYLPIPQEIRQHLHKKDILLRHATPKSSLTGIVLLKSGPMIISSRPIVTTKFAGPIRGTLITGRYITDETVDRIAKTTRSQVDIYAINDVNLPYDFQKASSSLKRNEAILVSRLNDRTIAGYALLHDIYNQPALLLRVELPREIYQQGQSSLRYLLVSLLIVGGIFSIVTLWLIDRTFNFWREQQQNEERYRAVVEQASEGILIVDAESKRIFEANSALKNLLGYTNEEVLNLTLYDAIANNYNAAEKEIEKLHIQSKEKTRECQYRRRDGSSVDVEVSANLISYNDRQAICVVVRDISDRKQAEEALRESEKRLSWQAKHDALTELANRREFDRCLQEALATAKNENLEHALLYLDLDRFKIVNDTCGHVAGDELLRQVSILLKTGLRKTDTLARLGGDEFGILLYQCPLDQAIQIANTLCDRLDKYRFVWYEKTFTIGVSIGLAIIDRESHNVAAILSAADVACNSAKNKGRNRVHIYQSDDRELEEHRGKMQWVSRIPQALEENRFHLYYQKIVPITPSDLRKEHYEILLRLEDETGQIVPPMAFIPAAERYNLMHLIDRWVINALFSYLAQQYPDVQVYPVIYAVNLSGASINDESFMYFVKEQLAYYRIPPSGICFEITETLAISNLNKAEQTIRQLRQLGCHFALDDFGSGMSSFAYLKNLSVDYLKIDGAFIKNIENDAIAAEMVTAIARVASVMGIQTIGEFVENDSILLKLKTLGVDYAQGYGIGKPSPLKIAVASSIESI